MSAENGDWLRGAIRCGASGNVTATAPVSVFRIERLMAES